MGKPQRTPAYIIFYILFLPDSWQILVGLVVAYFCVPTILSADSGWGERAGLYVMIASIGYVASRPVARRITTLLKKAILGDRVLRQP